MPTDDEIEDAARRLEVWADNVDPATVKVESLADLRAIADTTDAVNRNEALLTEQVAIARAHGRSWNRIALALGVSRQAAQQRFAGKVDA
jgi:hypothetical protein